MTRRPSYIPLRRPVFIGCEGASEVSYAGLVPAILWHALKWRYAGSPI